MLLHFAMNNLSDQSKLCESCIGIEMKKEYPVSINDTIILYWFNLKTWVPTANRNGPKYSEEKVLPKPLKLKYIYKGKRDLCAVMLNGNVCCHGKTDL